MIRKTTISVALLLAVAACGGGQKEASIDITKPISGEAATNAERAYKKGNEERKDQNYIEATRYYEWVRNNFPYSQYAALSELALADMAFEREDFAEAAVKYQDFVKSHPSHPKADWASFHVGLAHYKDKPSDWFFLPPSYEKDQQPIKDALDALQRFTIAYPKSEYVTQAKDLINDCRERLAAHERYVADFYTKKSAWKGAANRWLGIADTYGDLNDGRTRGDALWRAAGAFGNAKDVADERKTLERLVQETSASEPHHADAQRRLAALPKDAPPTPPEQAKEPATTPPEKPAAAPAPGQTPGDQPKPAPPPPNGPPPPNQ